MYNIYDKLWGNDITNSLIWIFIRTGQEMFSEKCEISKCHNFLISYPIFIIFAPICREIFTLSFEIMVILDWTSPLIRMKNTRFSRIKKEKMWLITKVHFSKIAETAHRASSTEAAYSDNSIAINSIAMAGCVNAVRAIVCFELPAQEASSFCDIWKLTSCDFIVFISSLIEVNFSFFRCAY